MLKLVEIPTIGSAKEQMTRTDDANNVFRVMHGFYGNLFLSKFATGEVTANGGDAGVASARTIWAHGLRDFDVSTVKTALARVISTHPEFPPTLPQFVALCKAFAPRQVYQHALPPPSVDRTEQARKARELLGSIRSTKTIANGLDLLKQAIADAVRCAGGEEGSELARLDRMFSGVAA
jgi:hypothetical protein